jgi:signal transduction histidine kinase
VLDVHARRLTAGAECRIAVIVVIRDVTDLARTAAMKADFVANASHELRTPLATIRAAVESLAGASEDRQERAKLAGILERQVARLEDMTNDLLNLHVVESGQVRSRAENVTAGQVAQYVRTQFAEPALRKNVALAVESADDAAAVRTDRKLLELIVQNLLDNAVKFTPAGGSVACRVGLEGESLVLTVADTGCGIQPQDQPRVFDRFFQSDSSRTGDTRVRGTGLGLAIVKHAADRLGAKVSLESELGRGTTITVAVPSQPS